jgi:hypothetical protein
MSSIAWSRVLPCVQVAIILGSYLVIDGHESLRAAERKARDAKHRYEAVKAGAGDEEIVGWDDTHVFSHRPPPAAVQMAMGASLPAILPVLFVVPIGLVLLELLKIEFLEPFTSIISGAAWVVVLALVMYWIGHAIDSRRNLLAARRLRLESAVGAVLLISSVLGLVPSLLYGGAPILGAWSFLWFLIGLGLIRR